MRKISRTIFPVPSLLRAAALRDSKRDLKQHYELEREVRHRRRAPFERGRLLHPDVLEGLGRVFRDRCAYCESMLAGTEEGVDHFRPVTGSRDKDGTHSPDHYGWFAYEWRNILLVCTECRRAKADFFPLDGPRAPLLCSWADASKLEEAQLIDPTVDDPLAHLTLRFDGDLAPLSEKGEVTIDLLKLNRAGLLIERREAIGALWNESDRFHPSAIEKAVTDSGSRPGSALLFIRALSDYMPGYRRSRHRTSTAFLLALPELLKSVTPRGWREAFEHYQRGPRTDYPFVYRASAERARGIYLDQPAASARVRTIAIRNFKGIENLTLDLGAEGESSFQAPCAMLLGENATGKSSVLQAVCLALMAPAERRALRLDAQAFLSREKSNWRLTDEREGTITIEMDGRLSAELSLRMDQPAFTGPGVPSMLVLAYGARRYFTSGRSRGSGVDATKTLFQPLSTIRDPTDWLQRCSPAQFDAVARAMFEVLALDRDDHIFKDEDGNVMVRAHGRDTPIARMSDGYKSLFAMAVDVMCRMVERWDVLESARGIVLIDEIETHLHPRWKMQVMGALRRALPQVQFIATTHDPLCLRGMRDGEVHVLFRNEAGDIDELEDLPSVEGLRAEQLLTSDYFGLATTSDPEMERLLDHYVERSSASPDAQGRDNQILRASLARTLSERTVIGDDASQQVVAEALARYLASRREATPIDRRRMREDAIRAVLDVLNARGS